MNVRDSRLHNYSPRWNGAPSQDLLVIRRNHKTPRYRSTRANAALESTRRIWRSSRRSSLEERSDVGVQYRVHFRAVDPDTERVQRIMRAPPGSESIREPEEVFLVDRVEQRDRRPLDDFVLQSHPTHALRVRDVLGELNRSLSRLDASEGRPSIPPEQLLSALLLQVFYGVRSERQLMEQLDYNFLYRWFVGLSPDDPVWDPTVFTKNRDRLQNGEVFAKFMTKLLNHPQVKPLLSDELRHYPGLEHFRQSDAGVVG
jgi:Transposase domain (DUF772)